MVNREWVISNIATILGGRTYLTQAGAEQTYLRHVYQSAINADAIKAKLEADQKKMQENLMKMPYN